MTPDIRLGAAIASRAIHVKYENGALKPLEPVKPGGEEVIVKLETCEDRIRRLGSTVEYSVKPVRRR